MFIRQSDTEIEDSIREALMCNSKQAYCIRELIEELEADGYFEGSNLVAEGWGYGDLRVCFTVYNTIGELGEDYDTYLDEWLELGEDLELNKSTADDFIQFLNDNLDCGSIYPLHYKFAYSDDYELCGYAYLE